MKNKHILEIYSHTGNLSEVDKYLKKVFNEFTLPAGLYNKVYLCVTEAVVNSIVHGNKNKIEKQVKIEASVDQGYMVIKINDEGQGFDIENIPDPTIENNVKKENGRGLHIIKSFADEIQFKDEGSSIEFKIKFSGKHSVSQ